MIRPLALNGVICLPGEHPFKGSCLIKDGKVASIGANEVCDSSCDTKTYDFGSNLIMPGFIEQHVHGALGSEFIDGSHTSNHKISTFLVRQGITAAVPTLITSPLSTIENAVRTLNLAVENDNLPVEIKGIFFEGPFISPRRKGAHRLEDIRSPQRELALQLAHLPLDTLKTVMLVAPEVSGGINLIRELSARGVIITGGHSSATYEQTRKAIEAGMRGATHLWNAMAPYHHREPGMVGAVLESEEVFGELICDHIHVHPMIIKETVSRKGIQRISLITDMTGPGGLDEGEYQWNQRTVFVSETHGIRIIGSDPSIPLHQCTLAGANLNTREMFRNLLKLGFSIGDFVTMRATTPARFLGLPESYGNLHEGGPGNVTVLSSDGDPLLTIVKGRIVFEKVSNKDLP